MSQNLRKRQSRAIHHTPVRVDTKSKSGKQSRPACALCSKGKSGRQTRWQCSSCEVPLCCVPFDNQQDVGSDEDDVVEDAARSCFKLWHDANDLMLEHQDQHELMMQAKAAKGGNRRERNDISLMDGLDDEEEHDLDYNYEDDQLGSCDEEDLDDDFEEEDLHHLMELDDNHSYHSYSYLDNNDDANESMAEVEGGAWSQETNNEVLVPHLPEQQDNVDEGHGTAV